MNTPAPLQQFRQAVYASLRQRADATLDLLDALTVAGHVESPVALSEQPLFRRQFSGVYDVLAEAALDPQQLAQVLYEAQPRDSDTLAGYEVYAVDTTPTARPAAETLADRGQWKKGQAEPVQVGHKYSWLARLVTVGTSWVAPQAVCRVPSATTDSKAAVGPVQESETRRGLFWIHFLSARYACSQRLPNLAGRHLAWARELAPLDRRLVELAASCAHN